MNRKEYAVELKHNGCNCAQAVLCTFSDKTGLTTEQLMKLGAGFGFGMGCMEATCGALLAAEMLMGLTKYEGKQMLRTAREIHQKFVDKCGASICKELKGIDTGVELCKCDDCIRNAVILAEEYCGTDI